MAKSVRELLDTVVQALPEVGNLGLLFFLLFYIFAALGVELFGRVGKKSEPLCKAVLTTTTRPRYDQTATSNGKKTFPAVIKLSAIVERTVTSIRTKTRKISINSPRSSRTNIPYGIPLTDFLGTDILTHAYLRQGGRVSPVSGWLSVSLSVRLSVNRTTQKLLSKTFIKFLEWFGVIQVPVD